MIGMGLIFCVCGDNVELLGMVTIMMVPVRLFWAGNGPPSWLNATITATFSPCFIFLLCDCCKYTQFKNGGGRTDSMSVPKVSLLAQCRRRRRRTVLVTNELGSFVRVDGVYGDINIALLSALRAAEVM